MIITLYIHIEECLIIDKLQIWISRFDWPTLIGKAEKNCLDIFKV